MKKIYEAWKDPENNSFSFATSENIKIKKTLLSNKAFLLFKIEANTYEEAMIKYHNKMGWEEYKPIGIKTPCPNNCGDYYYPDGSSECPNCGLIK